MVRLVIDQGNSRTKWASFEQKKIIQQGQLDRFHVPALEELIADQKPQYVILASTKHLTKRMVRFFKQHREYLVLSPDLHVPFVVEYRTPQTLGQDRIASVAGAWALFPGQNSLVIDAGTCITYDLIDSRGHFLGGNISPGIKMRLAAMHHFTDKLPLADSFDKISHLGKDTNSALQVGAQVGALYEIQGFIECYKQKLIKLNILLTGGDAQFFVNRLKTKIFAAPHLVLQGLNEILEYNVR